MLHSHLYSGGIMSLFKRASNLIKGSLSSKKTSIDDLLFEQEMESVRRRSQKTKKTSPSISETPIVKQDNTDKKEAILPKKRTL